MELKGANRVVERAQDALRLAVLWTSVRARELKHHAVSGEQGANGRIIELAAVVSLQGKERTLKLSLNVGKKLNDDR